MFAWRQSSHIGDDLNSIARAGERDRAHHLASGCGMKHGDGFFNFVR